jgi:ABC-2 type transport system ATP-binding protein
MDCRVDAIVPGLAWHSLETSLYRAEIVKLGWGEFLADIGSTQGTLDPHIPSAIESAQATGQLGEDDEAWFRERGPSDAVAAITAPTLFVQGTVDTLFTPAEALTNHRTLRDAGVPTAMVWFCGGHGSCSTHEPSTEQVTEATFAWLDRWVKGDESVELPTGLTVVDQDGTWWHVDDPDDAELVEAGSGSGTLELAEGSGAGPIVLPESDDLLAGLVEPLTTDPAEEALEVELTVPDGGLVLGAPRLSLRYSGTVEDGDRPVRVFGQLVDPATDTVVGHQVAPIELVLDGTDQSAEVDLEVVVHELEPGDRLVLQLVATTVAYATPRLGGEVTFETIEVSLPLAPDPLGV